jgi:molecular chaperone GrpE (heat shock protein)
MKHNSEHDNKGLNREEIVAAIEAAENFFVSQKAVLFDEATQKFLVILNADNKRWEFPGGLVDKEDENLSTALTREIIEEIGDQVTYTKLSVASTQKIRYNLNGGSYPVTVIGYLFLYQGGDIILSKEHLEFSWMSFDEIEALPEEKMSLVIKNLARDIVERLKERGYLSDLQRLQADFANYKRRQEESQKELRGFLVEKFLVDLLPVMDNFRMATGHVPAEAVESPWVTGITYIEKQLEKVLEENGVTTLTVQVGDTFDPALHEAVSQSEEAQSGEQRVAQVLQNGYKIGERIVRPAKVVVN